MDFTELASGKTVARDEIKKTFNLPKRSKILVAINFSDKQMQQKISKWLSVLPVNFILIWGEKNDKIGKNTCHVNALEEIKSLWIDAILCDCKELSLEKYMKEGIVPSVNEKNYLGKILSEFSAARGEWNAYLYEDDSYWSAYYALIRYLENLKFPYDNRNLVKNVLWV